MNPRGIRMGSGECFTMRSFIVCTVHLIVVRMEEGKRPLGRLRRRWEDNIRMDLKEMGINTWKIGVIY